MGKMIDGNHQALRPILDRVRAAGGRLWLVGGALRDLLLERPDLAARPPDFERLLTLLRQREVDLATDLRPERMLALFPGSRAVGARFGTVQVVLGDEVYEVTALRREGAYSDGRRPDEVSFTDDIEQDLARRDFTVNALAWELPEGGLLDPFGGLEDLEDGVLRSVGRAGDRLAEDGLRAYRACRFAATLEFALDDELVDALIENVECARGVAWERIGAELNKAVTARRPGLCFELLRRSGLLEHCLPELAACYGVPQSKGHEMDVYDHSLRACDAAPVDKPVVRWAALLHDIGKPVVRRRDGVGWTFHGHEVASAELAERALRRLRLERDLRERAVHLIRRHMFLYTPEWGDAAVRRFVRRVGAANLADLIDLALADRLAKRRESSFQQPTDIVELLERIEELGALDGALSVEDLALDGRDLLELTGRDPGPWVGRLLGELLEAVLDRPGLNTREDLIEYARELLESGGFDD